MFSQTFDLIQYAIVRTEVNVLPMMERGREGIQNEISKLINYKKSCTLHEYPLAV